MRCSIYSERQREDNHRYIIVVSITWGWERGFEALERRGWRCLLILLFWELSLLKKPDASTEESHGVLEAIEIRMLAELRYLIWCKLKSSDLCICARRLGVAEVKVI